jgi:ElaB/YqjD/DUF883 family membrane-anchored ribosome-binding protein
MSDQHPAPSADVGTGPRDPDVIREEISRTREDMGETLDALSAKLDVKSQAKAKVRQARDEAQSFYRRQPAAVVAGVGTLVALLAALLVRRARR